MHEIDMANDAQNTRPLSHLIHGGIQLRVPVTESPVDFRTPSQYAEDKHKDDVAVPTKKWKYL